VLSSRPSPNATPDAALEEGVGVGITRSPLLERAYTNALRDRKRAMAEEEEALQERWRRQENVHGKDEIKTSQYEIVAREEAPSAWELEGRAEEMKKVELQEVMAKKRMEEVVFSRAKMRREEEARAAEDDQKREQEARAQQQKKLQEEEEDQLQRRQWEHEVRATEKRQRFEAEVRAEQEKQQQEDAGSERERGGQREK
jgi:hypothetical protein